jgi:dTDP-glucose 4,6-dehydratase
MRLLVTGGLGFIGSHFVKAALRDPRVSEVIVLDAFTYASDVTRLEGYQESVEIVKGSILDLTLLAKFAGRVDCVVNFAAESHNDNSLLDPKLFFQTNLLGVVALAEFCWKNGVRLHHVSTDEVFGDMDFESTELFNSSSSLRPSSPYSSSKAAADLTLPALGRSFGLHYTISNCSNNFGAMQHPEKLVPSLFKSLSRGHPAAIYGTGKNIRDWIHVNDHVSGILTVLFDGAPQKSYLFGASDEVSNIQLAIAIGNFYGLSDGDSVRFVADRPGHDRRYGIDWSETASELGWRPLSPKILESIPELAQAYGE